MEMKSGSVRRMKRLAVLAAVACAAFSLPGLSACGISSKGGQTSSEASAAKADAKKAFIGYWKVSESGGSSMSSLEGLGLATFYRFEKDGTFTMQAFANGTTIKREGTWKLDGKDAVVNVAKGDDPTDADGETLGVSREIKDAVIKVDGDELATDDIGKGTTRLVKSSKSELDRFAQGDSTDSSSSSASASSTKQIALNQAVQGNGYSFTVTSLGYEEEIYPSDTSGYYQYYEDQQGASYLVARVTFTNAWTDYASIGWSTEARLSVGANKYSTAIELDAGSSMGQSYSIDPQMSGTVYIWAVVPDSVRGSAPAKLTWELPRDPSNLQTYYSGYLGYDTYELTVG